MRIFLTKRIRYDKNVLTWGSIFCEYCYVTLGNVSKGWADSCDNAKIYIAGEETGKEEVWERQTK